MGQHPDRDHADRLVLAQGDSRGRVVRERVAADVSELPTNAFGPCSVTWWGTMGFIVLEGTGFALGIGTYLYLRVLAPQWPLSAPPPDLLSGTLLTLVLLASI